MRRLSAEGQRLTLVANALWAPLTRAWEIIGAVGAGEVLYPVYGTCVKQRPKISFTFCRRRCGWLLNTGLWFAAADAGYTRLLPSTRAVLFGYDRNREFF